ncbi:MAG: hypothetical protein WDM78_11700 [Puia sp.]
MATCALTQGFLIRIVPNTGGIKSLFITERGNLTGITVSGGTVSALTVATGKRYWRYDFKRATGEYEEKQSINDANDTIIYNQDIKISLTKMEVNKRNEIQLLGQNTLSIIVLDNNGTYWLTGSDSYMRLITSDGKSGKSLGDKNGYDLNFTGEESYPAYVVPSGLHYSPLNSCFLIIETHIF